LVLLNVIAGIYLPNFWAWIFLLFVLVAETLTLSFYLRKVKFDKRIFTSVILSNSITTLIGYILLDENHYGGYLLNWVPIYKHSWALETESGEAILWAQTALFIFACFIVTTIIETISNFTTLRREYKTKAICKGTLMINAITYLIGTLIILCYGFIIIE
jgi:hypothetical protein